MFVSDVSDDRAVDTPAKAPPERGAANRWRHETLFDRGFVMTPTLFLRAYALLKPFPLTHGEAMYVLHLMQYKWDDDKPFPSHSTIARQMGVSAKQVQRYAASLEVKKYLRREARIGMSNRFDLVPLFNALEEHRIAMNRKASVS